MTHGRWSLARRLTVGFTVSTLLLVGSVAGVSGWLLNQAVTRELDALATETLEHFQVRFSNRSFNPEEFHEVALATAREHAATPLALRVYPDGLNGAGMDFGAVELLGLLSPDPTILNQTLTPTGALRERTGVLMVGEGSVESGTQPLMSIVVDGSTRLASLKMFAVVAAIMFVVSTLSAMLIGSLFGRHLSSQLRHIAERARIAVKQKTEVHELGPQGAPEEIREIADSMVVTLNTIRSESERSRLLIAGLAHELRHPIQNLIGEVEVLLLKGEGSDDTQTALVRQAEELDDLARSIDNLVTLCAHMQGSWEEMTENVNLHEELRLRPSVARKRSSQLGVELNIKAEGDLTIQGDREALLLVVHNIVGNALIWSPKNGRVDVSLIGHDDFVEFVVDDTGPGIPESSRETIFQPFNTGPSPDGHRRGFGLGLTLSKNVVARHRGTIEVSNSPSGGARFMVRLPRERDAGLPTADV